MNTLADELGGFPRTFAPRAFANMVAFDKVTDCRLGAANSERAFSGERICGILAWKFTELRARLSNDFSFFSFVWVCAWKP